MRCSLLGGDVGLLEKVDLLSGDPWSGLFTIDDEAEGGSSVAASGATSDEVLL